jgi:phosphopantothenate---cysteine ligase (ATP)
MASDQASNKFSAKEYFETQPPPAGLDEDVAKTRDFVKQQVDAHRKVVLVTVCLCGFDFCDIINFIHQSGGTTVPLEKNV